jgi:type I restriction enzyme S subunit
MDNLITALERQIEKKRLVKQGAMQRLLTAGEDWEVRTLGEVCDIIGGGTPSTSNNSYWNGDIDWFTPTEIGKEKYSYRSKRKITNEGLNASSAQILPIGTILLTSRAGIGDLSILTKEACTNQGFQSLSVKAENSNEFIYYLMKTLKNVLLKNASGSTFLEISPNRVNQIEISIPLLSEQTRIATILSDMDGAIEGLEKQLEKYRAVKVGLMQELLSGRKRLV